MNWYQSAWYWKKFYWKIFSVAMITGGGAAVATLGSVSPDVISTITAERIIIVLGIIIATVKGVDALVDQTFQQLSNGNGNGHTPNGNGHDVTVTTTTSAVQQPPAK